MCLGVVVSEFVGHVHFFEIQNFETVPSDVAKTGINDQYDFVSSFSGLLQQRIDFDCSAHWIVRLGIDCQQIAVAILVGVAMAGKIDPECAFSGDGETLLFDGGGHLREGGVLQVGHPP